jgi:hypothetical protein
MRLHKRREIFDSLKVINCSRGVLHRKLYFQVFVTSYNYRDFSWYTYCNRYFYGAIVAGISHADGRPVILLGTMIPLFAARCTLLMISRTVAASGEFYYVAHYAYQ